MTPMPMATYHWNISLSDTESIAMERALWLLINQEFPGKDAALEDAATPVCQARGEMLCTDKFQPGVQFRLF